MTITVTTGTVAAGATVITGVVTMNGVITVGIVMTTAGTAAGTKAEIKPGSAAIARAGATATTIAAAGDVVPADAVTVMDMAITNRRKGEPIGSPLLYSAAGSHQSTPSSDPTINQPFRLTTMATIAQPMPLTQRVFTRSPISFALLVNISSGTRASAMPKLSNT